LCWYSYPHCFLGLFGVAAFTAARRTKEIGIRKVFGARTRDVLQLLLWQFSIPVLIANVIAWPVAYYYLHHWLEIYAYRITLSPLYFLAAGLAALGIAWITIIAHATHVARASPIDALLYEWIDSTAAAGERVRPYTEFPLWLS
jgi:putative ABC transport system permease protein